MLNSIRSFTLNYFQLTALLLSESNPPYLSKIKQEATSEGFDTLHRNNAGQILVGIAYINNLWGQNANCGSAKSKREGVNHELETQSIKQNS